MTRILKTESLTIQPAQSVVSLPLTHPDVSHTQSNLGFAQAALYLLISGPILV